MPRIIISLALIAITGSAVVVGSTGAFFSDTETSSENVFTAGAIDLLIDNESYYNGELNDDTTWEKTDLTIEKFFNFLDLKPSDYGEDTISIHVDTNDAYLCADVTLTSNNENDQTEPEALVDNTTGETEGELANLVNFMWWADDGDNVLEVGENVISQGPIGALPIGQPYTLALADVTKNIWNANATPGPVPGMTTKYIGKAWCFGTLSPSPLPQDGGDQGRNPAGDNNGNQIEGEPADGGFLCDGSELGNESQTDSLTADVSFSAVQARHNSTFECVADVPVKFTTLTLVKEVINDDLGTAQPTDWLLEAEGTTNISGVTGSGDVTNAPVEPGVYNLSESSDVLGYTGSDFSCVVNDGAPVIGNQIEIEEGDNVVCTVTNDDNEPVACTLQESFADAVEVVNQGRLKNGGAVIAARSDATKALFTPQSLGTPYDDTTNPLILNGFFSLGFPSAPWGSSDGSASIVLSFNNGLIYDGPDEDLKLWEVTGGTSYPDEKVKVEVANNLAGPWTVVAASVTRDAEIDFNGLVTTARYVRITDASNLALFESTADGFDLDAVQALNCAERVVPLDD